MASARAAAGAVMALTAACSSQDDAKVLPVTADEQRALAEARAMIPAGEIGPVPTPVPTSRETPTP